MEYRSNYAVRFILIGLCLAAIAVLAVMLFRTPSKRPGESSAAAPETTAAPPETVPETAEYIQNLYYQSDPFLRARRERSQHILHL